MPAHSKINGEVRLCKFVMQVVSQSFCLIILGFLLSFPPVSLAQDRSNLGDIYRQDFLLENKQNDSEPPAELVSFNLNFHGGSRLNVVYPKNLESLASVLRGNIDETHARLSKHFGEIPGFESSLRLMDEELFYLSTGAPSWTNALFYKGQIMIPVPNKKAPDMENIIRSVKHEYTHAVIHALSQGNCPGWLDEGLAQWAEGPENPALQPALFRYLNNNPPVPLDLLQNGFTKLKTRMVPAAYAQSLFATHTIINSFGVSSIGTYLKNLRKESNKSLAFYRSFKLSEKDFEKMLGANLKDWRKEYPGDSHIH